MDEDGPSTGNLSQRRRNAADQFAKHHKPYEVTTQPKVQPEKHNQTYPKLRQQLSRRRSTANVSREKQDVGVSKGSAKKRRSQLPERKHAVNRKVTKRHARRQCSCRKCREVKKRREAAMSSMCCLQW